MDCKRLVNRPAFDLGGGDLRHQRPILAHRLTVKRRREQPAHPQVPLTIERQHRAWASRTDHARVCLSGPQHLRIAGEQLLDQPRIPHHHHLAKTQCTEGHQPVEAAKVMAHQRLREEHHRQRLHDRRPTQPRRKPRRMRRRDRRRRRPVRRPGSCDSISHDLPSNATPSIVGRQHRASCDVNPSEHPTGSGCCRSRRSWWSPARSAGTR
jgi:hypothetical protein